MTIRNMNPFEKIYDSQIPEGRGVSGGRFHLACRDCAGLPASLAARMSAEQACLLSTTHFWLCQGTFQWLSGVSSAHSV